MTAILQTNLKGIFLHGNYPNPRYIFPTNTGILDVSYVTEITLCGDYTWLLAHLTTALTPRQQVFINDQLNDIPLSPPGDWELEVKSELNKMHGPSGGVL